MSENIPEEGEVWFVRAPGETQLYEGRVTSVTAKTIELAPVTASDIRERYKRGDIEFVERKSARPIAPAHVGEAWPKPES